MRGRSLALILAALLGLAGTGCRKPVEMPPTRPAQYESHIKYDTDGRRFELFTGTDEGDILTTEKDGVKRTYWDREPKKAGIEYFIMEGGETAYIPNPGSEFTAHYKNAVGKIGQHIERGSYNATR